MNRSVVPASCRQKKLGSADETSAARCWAYVSFAKVHGPDARPVIHPVGRLMDALPALLKSSNTPTL